MNTRLKETVHREKGIIVGLVTPRVHREQVKEYLDELALLADTAGVEVQHRIIQERDHIDPATFIGKGKAEEIGWIVDHEKIDAVIFDDDLSPVQVRNLEKAIQCKILDRAGLILDIFASRAKSKEAMTQVELAQLQYLLPRLTRQWIHLSKQYGGVGTKGPGEQQIETDRRVIRARITHLKEKLELISKEREVQRRGRRFFNRVAFVGYTNAGKSTLMNFLSQSNVFVEDRLFATLDATARRVKLSDAQSIILTDTVGFIRKLPPHLIASFKSTLAEVIEADLLLHVVDVSHPAFEEQIQIVQSTLEELHADAKPTIMVFNKIDRLVRQKDGGQARQPDRSPPAKAVRAGLAGQSTGRQTSTVPHLRDESRRSRTDSSSGLAPKGLAPKGQADRSIIGELSHRFPNAVCISAIRGINVSGLIEKIQSMLSEDIQEETLVIPQAQYNIVSKIHEIASVIEKVYEDNCIKIRFQISRKNSEKLLKLLGRQTSQPKALKPST